MYNNVGQSLFSRKSAIPAGLLAIIIIIIIIYYKLLFNEFPFVPPLDIFGSGPKHSEKRVYIPVSNSVGHAFYLTAACFHSLSSIV